MKKIRIGLIPAAGKGSRMSDLPLTRILPKSMLPILNKPIIEHVIARMRDFGVEIVYLVVGFKKEVIQEYFQDGKDFGVEIRYLIQDEPNGIAQAISLAEKDIQEPFIVILGDDFTVSDSFSNLLNKFWNSKTVALTGIVAEEDANIISQTNSVLIADNGKIEKIIEKPKKPDSNIRGCGIYIFQPTIFDFIRKTPISSLRNQREITDTLDLLARQGKAYAEYIHGVNININTLDNLYKATLFLLGEKSKYSIHH